MKKTLLVAAVALVAGCGGSNDGGQAADRLAERTRQAAITCGNELPALAPAPRCTTPAARDGEEMTCNPHLAQSPWAASHRNNFAQASSPFPGVTTPDRVNIDRVSLLSAPISLTFSEPDAQGHQAAWASTVGFNGEIIKVDARDMTLIDRFNPGTGLALSESGAYNLLDRDQNLIVGQGRQIAVYGDRIAGDRRSGIQQLQRLTLPADALCGNRNDELVGITLLHDGQVAFATKFGKVGVLPRQPAAMCAATIRTLSLNGEDVCNDSTVPDQALEQISNSISADETNAIYVVTSQAQYRIDWDGQTLTQSWRAPYAVAAGAASAGRLGAGSGSTPSLMGTPADRDRFVVITDAQNLMHLVLMWKDAIPADWQPIKPGRDRRIACEIPINFGNESAQESLSEQSVLVRGYAAVVVNNKLRLDRLFAPLPQTLQPFVQLTSGLSYNKPQGLQRVDWDPASRTCRTVWNNPDISLPNGIPTLSAETNLIYGIGARRVLGFDTWTLEAIDFDSGQSRFHIPSTPYPTDNSFYAATTIGPDRSIWTGTFGGIVRYQDCADGQPCGRNTLNPIKHFPLQRP